MPRAKPDSKAGGALCHCGKPLGHTGRHIGSPARVTGASKPNKRTRFSAAVQDQIKSCHDTIARLKAEMREREVALRSAEAELKPLVALNEVYANLALPAPTPPKEETAAPPASSKPFRIGEGTA